MDQIEWIGIIKAGWPVLLVLLIGSIISIGIVLERWKIFSKVNLNYHPFLDNIRKFADSERIIASCERSTQPVALLTKAIYLAPDRRDDRERLLSRAIQKLVKHFEHRLSVLGTIASVAPFVGLLGTVIGIIKSFRAVSVSAQGGASVVALGIAEALVGTAGGLVVAIPALLGYNYFVNKLRIFTQDWEIIGGEIIDLSLSHTSSQNSRN